MKKHLFYSCFIFLFSFLSSAQNSAQKKFLKHYPYQAYCYGNNDSYYTKKTSLLKKYATSIIPGAIVGSVTGSVCALTDKAGFFPFSWFIFLGLRWLIIDALSKDFVDFDISYNKNVLLATARISDWVAWLYITMCRSL